MPERELQSLKRIEEMERQTIRQALTAAAEEEPGDYDADAAGEEDEL